MKMKTILFVGALLTAVLLGTSAGASNDADVEERVRVLEEKIERVETEADSARSGLDRFLLRGYGSVGFVDREHDDSTFQASVSPLLLWQVADRALFEAELEIELEDGDTNVELEYGDLSYVLTDWLTLVGGKFLTPFTIFSERLHPSWINKLPDSPLVFAHGTAIAPRASLGAAARGGAPLGSTRLNYAVYVANGPEYGGHGEEEVGMGDESAGMLEFDNYDDFENSKAFGGRIGFLPIAQLEIGYSIYYADVDTDEGNKDVVLNGVDVSYVLDSDWLRGVLDVRAEWVWSDADEAEAEVDDEEVFFDNKRDGGYVQVAHRLSKIDNAVVRNLELVARYDALNDADDSPSENDRERVTIGMNYWFLSSGVVKVAYQFDSRDEGDDQDAILLQTALGF